MRVKSVGNLLNVCFFLGLLNFLLDLLDFSQVPFLYVFRVENVSFEVLDFFYLLLSNLFASSKLVLVRFKHPHCMIF